MSLPSEKLVEHSDGGHRPEWERAYKSCICEQREGRRGENRLKGTVQSGFPHFSLEHCKSLLTCLSASILTPMICSPPAAKFNHMILALYFQGCDGFCPHVRELKALAFPYTARFILSMTHFLTSFLHVPPSISSSCHTVFFTVTQIFQECSCLRNFALPNKYS